MVEAVYIISSIELLEEPMTIMKNMVAGLAAAAMISTPALAQVERAGAPAQDSEEAFGGGVMIPILIFAAAIATILVVAADDDIPVSP